VSETNFEAELLAVKLDKRVGDMFLRLSDGRLDEVEAGEIFDSWTRQNNSTEAEINTLNAWWDRAIHMRKAVIDAEERGRDAGGRIEPAVEIGRTKEFMEDQDRVEQYDKRIDDLESQLERKNQAANADQCAERDDHGKRKDENKRSKKPIKKSRRYSPSSSDDSDTDDGRRSGSESNDSNPNTRKPIIFLSDRDDDRGLAMNRRERRLQRKQQKIYFTGKTARFQTTYQLEIKLPIGMSFGGALIILTQGRYPLQCFRTQENFDPSGRKYSKVKDLVQKYAIAFDNLSDWCLAQAAFKATLVAMNRFEEEGLVRYDNHALAKYTEIVNAHQTVPNGKELAFQKFVIFETEVRNRIEDNDDYEWNDKEVWEEVARRKFPNVRDIATSTPFRPTEGSIQQDGSVLPVTSVKGKFLGAMNQFGQISAPIINGDQSQKPGEANRYVSNSRGGRGMRGYQRGSYRGKWPSYNTYNHSAHQESNMPGVKQPCEHFNRGRCIKSADDCRFGHYCAQYRNNVGDGCGPRNAHSYSIHGPSGTQGPPQPAGR